MEVIRVIHHHQGGKWWSESPDVDGCTAAGDTLKRSASSPRKASPWALERDDVRLEHFVPAPA